LGAPFFIMERRRGIVLREECPPEIDPRHASGSFVDCMARLHAIELSTAELRAMGKPEGYIERQVRGWAERWNRAKTEELPEVDDVIAWLAARIPPSTAPTLIHNDYKLDNVMLAPGKPERIEAVLDWEMATIGDPLSDLGLTLCYWVWAAAPEVCVTGAPALTAQPGWYTREELIQTYSERTGRDVGNIGYYEVLGVFKLAVIIQQIYCRFHRGQTQDARFRDFGERAKRLGTLAARLAGMFSLTA
jgi:aminoglycoside phosphotransferase (APT) family kinase protein